MSMPRQLPARPNLEHLRRQARTLHRQLQRNDPDAIERFRAIEPDGDPGAALLVEAQHVLAREYGFASWPKLRAHVLSAGAAASPAEELAAAIQSGRPERVADTLARHPELRGAELDRALPGEAFGATPLLAAIRKGSREMIDLLLQRGANLEQRSHWWAGGFGVLDHARGLAEFLIGGGRGRTCRGATRQSRASRRAGRGRPRGRPRARR
jgi:hypothetical protein